MKKYWPDQPAATFRFLVRYPARKGYNYDSFHMKKEAERFIGRLTPPCDGRQLHLLDTITGKLDTYS
jgi:hypothetical protein